MQRGKEILAGTLVGLALSCPRHVVVQDKAFGCQVDASTMLADS